MSGFLFLQRGNGKVYNVLIGEFSAKYKKLSIQLYVQEIRDLRTVSIIKL